MKDPLANITAPLHGWSFGTLPPGVPWWTDYRSEDPGIVIQGISDDIALAEDKLRSLPRLADQDPDSIVPGIYRLDAKDFPLRQMFAPGVYLREIVMPEGAWVIGMEHRTKHFNLVIEGCARVMMNGKIVNIEAPAIFVSEPGVQKVLYIHRTCRWVTIHATDEQDPDKLRELLVNETSAELSHRLELEKTELLRLIELERRKA